MSSTLKQLNLSLSGGQFFISCTANPSLDADGDGKVSCCKYLRKQY